MSNFRQYGQMEKQRWEESRRRRKEVRRSEKRKSEGKEDAGARKGRKVQIHQWFVARGGRKVGSLKRRVRSHLPKWEMKNCTPLSREAHFQVKMYKPHQVRTTFFELSCRKNARRCGTKHVSKSKCTKHIRFGPLFQVELSKKCTPLWHEAHIQVKMYETPTRRTTFPSWAVEKVHAVVARSTYPSQNVRNTPGSDHFFKLVCRKSARRCGTKHVSKSKCTKHQHVGPLFQVELSKKCTPLWREAHFQVKMYKRHYFWKLKCSKSARRCGTKHIPSQKCEKTEGFGLLFDVQTSKKSMPCGAKHISKSKVSKTVWFGPLLDGRMSFCVACARDSAPCEKWAKREALLAVSTKPPIHYTTLH